MIRELKKNHVYLLFPLSIAGDDVDAVLVVPDLDDLFGLNISWTRISSWEKHTRRVKASDAEPKPFCSNQSVNVVTGNRKPETPWTWELAS